MGSGEASAMNPDTLKEFGGCMVELNISRYYLRRISVFILSLALALAIGYFHILAGKELALSLFFLIPIVSATWYSGTPAGVSMAVACIMIWLYTDLKIISTYSAKWLPFLNEGLRLTVFLFVVSILHRMKEMIRIHKNLAVHDSLTGIFNRRGFNIEGFKEIERSRRTGNPFSIVYMDIDNFKEVNDTLGHHTGDALLACVGGILKSRLRNMDIVARPGGDEFLMMLPRTTGKAAEQAIKKLKNFLDDAMARNNWAVSFSFGIASFSNGIPASVNIAVSSADRLMYIAKNSGKNRIEIGEAEQDGSISGMAD